MRAWDPLNGQPVQRQATILADDAPTRQLGVPRAPAMLRNHYQPQVQERLNLGLSSLSSLSLKWDELGLAARALLGGAANFAPLDSELPLPWLHELDARLAELPRRALHLGRSSRQHFYPPVRKGGLTSRARSRNSA